MEENTLIQFARKGDLDAFNRLVLAYQNRLFYQAYRLLGNAQSAEDATQEAFLTAYRKLDQFRGGSFRIWLLRIVTNLCYDELRRIKRRRTSTVDIEYLQRVSDNSDSSVHDAHQSPEETVILLELYQAVRHGLDQLPLGYRTAVLLVDIQGLAYKEAAEVMGTSLGTLKSRLARGRVMLVDACRNSHSESNYLASNFPLWSISSKETNPARTAKRAA
jgi:RNA polymerase sigma factor (sigma-70 family)